MVLNNIILLRETEYQFNILSKILVSCKYNFRENSIVSISGLVRENSTICLLNTFKFVFIVIIRLLIYGLFTTPKNNLLITQYKSRTVIEVFQASLKIYFSAHYDQHIVTYTRTSHFVL